MSRPQKIASEYLSLLDAHISDLESGKVEYVKTIYDFAEQLAVHHKYLGEVVKNVTGRSTCDWFESKLLAIAKKLLVQEARSIADVACQLDYDPSNFTKFFKAYTGQTPSAYRKQLRGSRVENS